MPPRVAGEVLDDQPEQVVVGVRVAVSRPGPEQRRLGGGEIKELADLPHLRGMTRDLLVDGGREPIPGSRCGGRAACEPRSGAHRESGALRWQAARGEGGPRSDSRFCSTSCRTTTATNVFAMLPARKRSALRIGAGGATEPRPTAPVQVPSAGLSTCRIAPGKCVPGLCRASCSTRWSRRARTGSKRRPRRAATAGARAAALAGQPSPAAASAPAAPSSSVLRSAEGLAAPSAPGPRSTCGILLVSGKAMIHLRS